MMFNQLWTLKPFRRFVSCLLAEMMRHLLRTENDTLRVEFFWVNEGMEW
jgi:hypothetical protein